MKTLYLEEKQQSQALQRNQSFWKGAMEEGPLMWVTAPKAGPSRLVPEPASEKERWTNVDYVIAATEGTLSGTHYAGDALPVYCPWLGPDQYAAWLGAELVFRPRNRRPRPHAGSGASFHLGDRGPGGRGRGHCPLQPARFPQGAQSLTNSRRREMPAGLGTAKDPTGRTMRVRERPALSGNRPSRDGPCDLVVPGAQKKRLDDSYRLN